LGYGSQDSLRDCETRRYAFGNLLKSIWPPIEGVDAARKFGIILEKKEKKMSCPDPLYDYADWLEEDEGEYDEPESDE
jgi:hypothetical protein